MKSKQLKYISIILILTMSFSIFSVKAFADSYESYTYWDDVSGDGRKAVYNRTMYECKMVLKANDIGVDNIEELIDVCIDNIGNIYILDTKKGIIILDENYNLKNIIECVKGNEELKFKDAKSIYVDLNGVIYICDTENARVITCDDKGKLFGLYTLPDSPLIPKKFRFKPIRVVSDSKNYVYILSEGSYYGALLYDPEKRFMGFYGSNTVTNGIIDGIKGLFKTMFPNNKKAANSFRALPFCFTDIVIDKNDFVYTATDSAYKDQIKKLNPGQGNNILSSKSLNFIDDEVNRTFLNEKPFIQKLTGLDIDKRGFIYAVDSSYGRIFLYDSNGKMITAFGGGMGVGSEKGTFLTASAIAVNDINNDVFVCDKTNNTLSVFVCNEYGKEVLRLIDLTEKGNYTETKKGWEEVLKKDKNLQIAYTGLACAYLAEKNYKKAMEISLQGYDRETYSIAFENYRTEWLSSNFKYIFFSVLAFAIFLICICALIQKKDIVLIKNEKISLMFNASIHPGKTFEIIKDKNKGSLLISAIIVLIFYITSVIKTVYGGFIFTSYEPGSYNSLLVFVRSAGFILLWAISNWLVCSLLSGKGKLKEIIIITSYSLLPMIIGNILWTVISNFVLPSEAAILRIIVLIFVIYSSILLIIGMLRIHEYTLTKFIGTGVLTFLGMIAIIFLMILVGILLQQLVGFISTILIEIFL